MSSFNIERNFSQANELTRARRYQEALIAYRALLNLPANQYLSRHLENNINYIINKLSEAPSITSQREHKQNMLFDELPTHLIKDVFCSNDAIKQTTLTLQQRYLRPGITALLRAKNAGRFIKGAVLSVIDLVDEVVAVDNYSTDNTWVTLLEMSQTYPNLRTYKYSINIPRVGHAHSDAVASGSTNTLGTYYNWCLSKVNTMNVLKWDADFIAIRRNLKELINNYGLRSSSSNTSIWCTGVTSFSGRAIRPDSWYDEFRIFSTAYGAKWDDYKGCETILNSINASESCFINGFNDDSRRISKELLDEQKKSSKPIFIELKDSINLKSNAMILDDRDSKDNIFIKKYINTIPDYYRPNKLNEYRVLVSIPSLVLGGGNYWAKLIFDQLSHLGINVDIGVNDCSNEDQILNCGEENFYEMRKDNLLFISEHNKYKYKSYTHIMLSAPFPYPEAINTSSRVFIFTHSDISYINQYALGSGYKPVALNEATVEKFSARNTCCMLLRNYLPDSPAHNTKKFESDNIKILYCNRISFDKNVPMLLLAFRYLLDTKETTGKIKLTLLAGGAEYSNLEYNTIVAAIKKLDLGSYVDLRASQKDVEKYYLSHDFCILASVSEGCSYGLLEAINYGIPIITTDISPNREITENLMPTFQLSNICKRSSNSFSCNDYNDYLHDIGYVDNETISNSGEATFIFERLYNCKISSNEASFQDEKPSVYVPYLLPDISGRRLEHEYIEYIKKFDLYKDLTVLKKEDQHALLNKKIAEIGENLKPYLEYWREQNVVFEQGAHSILNAMKDMIANFPSYKSNVVELKRRKHSIYFSTENSRRQLYSLLFSDDFIFE